MKKIVKIMSLVMALVLCLSLFAACGKEEETKEKLIMGTNAAFPPYEFYEGDKIVGIDAEIAEALAGKLGMEIEIRDMDFNGILGAIESGVVDIGLAGMTVTPDRLKQVNFSTSYAKGIQVVIVKEGSGIKKIEDLEGKKIGVQEATTGDIYSTDDFGEENVKRYTNGAAAVQALQSGIVDAVIIDNEPAKAFVKENKGLTILETSYADEDYAIAVSKENTELLEKINTALAELKEEGKIDEIVNRYIPAE